jgi:ribosome-associated heat shock protein Hsp15
MSEQSLRIDKWLFYARIVKSRSLAAKLVQSGRVRINGAKIDQASRHVGESDVLTITLDRVVRVLKVAAVGDRRGPFEEARLLYEDMSPQPSTDRSSRPAAAATREPGSGRPTKRERRQLDIWNANRE